MNKEIVEYNSIQNIEDQKICEQLATIINSELKEAES